MENKIGYAYISLEDYKELIENNKSLENIIKELQHELNTIKNEYTNIENKICEKIYDNYDYLLESYDGINQYYHNKLVEEFQRYGYCSFDKINELISLLVERYKKEGETKDEK